MIIINGAKFYKKQIEAAKEIASDQRYDGRNYQWYTLRYNPDCGLVILHADNSGDCYGDYKTRYYSSVREFRNTVGMEFIEGILGDDINEEDETTMKFVDELLK